MKKLFKSRQSRCQLVRPDMGKTGSVNWRARYASSLGCATELAKSEAEEPRGPGQMGPHTDDVIPSRKRCLTTKSGQEPKTRLGRWPTENPHPTQREEKEFPSFQSCAQTRPHPPE